MIGASGHRALFLAEPSEGEQVAFLPTLRPYRILVDGTLPAVPGATVREFLGHGERAEPFEVEVVLVDSSGGRRRASPVPRPGSPRSERRTASTTARHPLLLCRDE